MADQLYLVVWEKSFFRVCTLANPKHYIIILILSFVLYMVVVVKGLIKNSVKSITYMHIYSFIYIFIRIYSFNIYVLVCIHFIRESYRIKCYFHYLFGNRHEYINNLSIIWSIHISNSLKIILETISLRNSFTWNVTILAFFEYS